MKSIVVLITLTLSFVTQASVTVTEKSFTCQNATGTIVITEKKIKVLREVSRKHFDYVIRDNTTSEVTPDDQGAILVYADKKGSDVVVVKAQTDRQVLQVNDDKCTDDYYSKTSYNIVADVSLEGLSTRSVNMSCIEEISVYEQETP